MAVFTDKNGHHIVTFGEGTTSIVLAKENGSNIDNTVFFINQETPKPLGTKEPELIGIHSDDLPQGSVRLVFTTTHGLWNFMDNLEKMVAQHRQTMEDWSDERKSPSPDKMRQA